MVVGSYSKSGARGMNISGEIVNSSGAREV
jgi:hypothetical protein